MTLYRIICLLFLIILFGQCASQYEKGEKEFSLHNYEEAKSYFELVEHGIPNYERAQIRILEIETIFQKHIFDRAVGLFDEKMYADAESFFFKIDSANGFYYKSQTFLKKIDSIRHSNLLENEKRKLERRVKEEKNKKRQKLEDTKALIEIKKKVRVLFNELLAFKDKSDFHYYGFGVGYKYNRWLIDVKALKDTPEARLLLGSGFVVGDLEMLGLEYVSSRGAETEYSMWAKKTISSGLNK